MSDEVVKQVDLGEPTPLLDQLKVVRTQWECKPNLKIVRENKHLLQTLISAGTIKQFLGWEIPRGHRRLVLRYGRTCVEVRG